jgi:hypothetical protein
MYTKTTWTDRVVQYPHRYDITLVSGTIYDFTAVPGTITAAGTGVVQSYMNNIEDGVMANQIMCTKVRRGGLYR